MNTKQLVVSSMIAASFAAVAFTSQAAQPSSKGLGDEAYLSFVMPDATSDTSRATVQAGVFQARARGELVAGQATPRQAYDGASTLARADVREAVLDARRHGELATQGELIAPATAQHAVRPALFARNMHR